MATEATVEVPSEPPVKYRVTLDLLPRDVDCPLFVTYELRGFDVKDVAQRARDKAGKQGHEVAGVRMVIDMSREVRTYVIRYQACLPGGPPAVERGRIDTTDPLRILEPFRNVRPTLEFGQPLFVCVLEPGKPDPDPATL